MIRAKKGTVIAWMEAHVGYAADECLEFPFSRTRFGRGAIRFGGETLAHRWMCRAAHGKMPDGSPFALHSCGNGHLGCVNPKHLYWGTGSDNYRDQIKHGVAARGERSGKAKLNEALVEHIRELRKAGKGAKAIAAQTGLHKDAVRSVVRGRTWAWL